MDTRSILATIDAEISRLQQARALLAGLGETKPNKVFKKRRSLSAKARKAIADAQRKRWALVKAKKK